MFRAKVSDGAAHNVRDPGAHLLLYRGRVLGDLLFLQLLRHPRVPLRGTDVDARPGPPLTIRPAQHVLPVHIVTARRTLEQSTLLSDPERDRMFWRDSGQNRIVGCAHWTNVRFRTGPSVNAPPPDRRKTEPPVAGNRTPERKNAPAK
jgi:hypothetical protein